MATAAPLNIGFGTPFDAQIDFLRQKLHLPTDKWDDIERAAHDKAFIVAGAAKADLLADLHAAVIKSAEGGAGLKAFQKDFKAIVAKHGWTGWTGEGTKEGEAWRTRVIYQTNMATSYSAGRYLQMSDPAVLKLRPYWRYIHSEGALHPRPHHLAWHGLTLLADHPFWQSHYPINGWGCRCRVAAVSRKEGEASARAALDDLPPGWDQLDPKTGAPVGIDKGFNYAPGASVTRPLQELIDAKLINLNAPLGAQMWEALKPVLRQEQADAYREWLNALDVDSKAKSLNPIIGALDPQDLAWLQASGKRAPATAQISVSSSTISGPKALRHASAGDALPAQVWENLPELIAEPLAVLYDENKNTMLYVLPEPSARRGQVVVEFDYQRKDLRNMVVSAYRPQLGDLLERIKRGTLTLMRGVLE